MGYMASFMFKLFLKISFKVFEKECNKNETCRKCKFGTLWNGCKLMEISPAEWKNEVIKDIK